LLWIGPETCGTVGSLIHIHPLEWGGDEFQKRCKHRDGVKGKNAMTVVVVLLALSAVMGFALGSLSWFAIAASGVALAALSSAALHLQGFGAFPGIAIVIACLTVNQIAYLAGIFANQQSSRPIPKKASAKPSWFG
jgi:hypothetical protein